ncbi:MAG: FAD-binding oxidoreductase [Saprospiraceae bacterium]
MNLILKLKEIVGVNNVLDSFQASERTTGIWAGNKKLKVKGMVFPKTTEEVSAILAMCYEMGQPIIPQGGLTNLTFATQATPEDWIISLEKMNKIEEIDTESKVVIVQAGVVLQLLQEAVAEQELLYPVDYGARGSAMIGGSISTNAGGIQVLRYGTTRNQVLGLEVVLPDGRVLSSLNKMIKDNAGYDLKHLFIGSEGTLGIITKASLRLISKPTTRNTALVALDSFDKVIAFKDYLDKHLSGALTSFELIWQDYYQLMTNPPAPYKPPLPQDYPFYLLFEGQGNDEEKDQELFLKVMEKSLEKSLILDGTIAFTQADYSWFWGIRENVEILLSSGPLYVFDVSLPIPEMENYCQHLKTDLQNKFGDHELYIFGHFGDGNLHIGIRVEETFGTNRKIVEGMVYNPLTTINGSITAEHGIGLEKKEWLHICRSEVEIDLMKQIKQLLDPKGILNPNKIF